MSIKHFDDQVRQFWTKMLENSVFHVAQLYDLYRKHEISEEEFSQYNSQINNFRRDFIDLLDKVVAADEAEVKSHVEHILDMIYGYGELAGRIDTLVSVKLTQRMISNAKIH